MSKLHINFKFADAEVKKEAKRRKAETKAESMTAYINSLILADGKKNPKR